MPRTPPAPHVQAAIHRAAQPKPAGPSPRRAPAAHVARAVQAVQTKPAPGSAPVSPAGRPAAPHVERALAGGKAPAQRAAAPGSAVRQHVVQPQKAPGWYQVVKAGNLRNNNAQHTVKRKLVAGEVVRVIDKGTKVSNFKAGWVTNEHSWVVIEAEDEYGDEYGWVEDSKLGRPKPMLPYTFQSGDKLYGRYEERRRYTNRGEAEFEHLHQRYSIIDYVNEDILARRESPEATSFGGFLEGRVQGGLGRQALINKFCKLALIHYTRSDHTIHFMLDGIDPRLVVNQARGGGDEDEHTVTGVELRALMRAAMRHQGLRDAKYDPDVDLTKVRFYLNGVEVRAPWAASAKSVWGKAWRKYVALKRHGTQPTWGDVDARKMPWI